MSLVVLPRQMVVTINGVPRVGAKLYVYDAGTSTPRNAYNTSAYSALHPSPVISPGDGFFPAVYVKTDDGPYKLVVKDADDVSIWTEDNIPATEITQAIIAQALYPVSDEETAAGVTPVNQVEPYKTVHRYGTNTSPGTTNMTAAIGDALNIAEVSPSADGTNSAVNLQADIYGITGQIEVPYSVVLNGEGAGRSVRILVQSNFAELATTGAIRLGNGNGVAFGTTAQNILLDCNSIAGSTGVFSSDVQDGGCWNVTVNNFGDYGFRFDPTGTTFGSVNGFLLSACQAFKRNSGGTGGIAFYLKDGTFPALLQLCQAFGNPANPLGTGYYATNIPFVAQSINVDGAATVGMDLNASVPMFSIHGFTSNGATTAVDISTTGVGCITGLYMAAGTTAITDAGNGGAASKSITDPVVPLFWRGQYAARGDKLYLYQTLTVIGDSTLGNVAAGGTLAVTGTATFNGGTYFSHTSAAVPTNGSTIATGGVTVSRVNPAGSVTGVILQAGNAAGQKVVVINESSNTVTFAAAGTSNVANGTSMVIGATEAAAFYWNTGTSRWYHAA